ncbi:polysaccharide deacetylase family protein [Streptomyces sp. NBC_00344]
MTEIDRRRALRTGAGAAVAGALAAGCSGGRPAAGTPSAPAPPAPARPDTPPTRRAPAPRAFPGQPVQVDHGPRDRARVALTFHGQGDPAIARSVLDEAERAGARITVLAVGTWLDEYPRMARRILDGGHDLGNHTLHHTSISSMGEQEAYAEITGCADRLRRLTGSIGTWFRPSRARDATPLVRRLAVRAGYPHVLSYDTDSLDYTSPGATAVTRTVIAGVRKGSVVSMHFGYPGTVAALPVLLDALDRRGLHAVTTTELLTP